MQTQLNKSKKIFIDTRHEYKANKTIFTILSLSSKKLCNKQHYGQQAQNWDKTLINMRDSCKNVVPLERTFHKEPNKI